MENISALAIYKSIFRLAMFILALQAVVLSTKLRLEVRANSGRSLVKGLYHQQL